ncbi:unnamed protein product, partial [Ixodes pacificus]
MPVSPAAAWTVRSRQRDPKAFAGLRDEDIEDRIESFERLANVAFYLVDVAKTWFLNHEDEIPNWTSFTTKIREIFGTPTSRKENAKKKLQHRQQQNEETYTSYIEDVLTLCRRADADMRESDRVRHILKGIADTAFNVFLVQN